MRVRTEDSLMETRAALKWIDRAIIAVMLVLIIFISEAVRDAFDPRKAVKSDALAPGVQV